MKASDLDTYVYIAMHFCACIVGVAVGCEVVLGIAVTELPSPRNSQWVNFLWTVDQIEEIDMNAALSQLRNIRLLIGPIRSTALMIVFLIHLWLKLNKSSAVPDAELAETDDVIIETSDKEPDIICRQHAESDQRVGMSVEQTVDANLIEIDSSAPMHITDAVVVDIGGFSARVGLASTLTPSRISFTAEHCAG